MISLGGVVLSDHLLLPGIKNIPLRAGSVRTTLGGRPVKQSIALQAGQIIELVDPADDGRGYLTGDQIDSINVFRASSETVAFVHHLGSWQVTVEVVDVREAYSYANPNGDDTYSGTITLRIME